MSFDLLAPHYRWMEGVQAGSKLQRGRTAFLSALPAPRRALLVGEGNGRFLVELLRVHPALRIVCVDASARMIECARTRLRAHHRDADAVQFVHADLLEWSPPPESFDLIVTHFFLDCFSPAQIAGIVARLAAVAAPDAHWLLADFHEPPSGWARWRARWILRTMYLFFRWTTRLPAARLTPPDPFLEEHGFALRERRLWEWGLLHSDLWARRTNQLL